MSQALISVEELSAILQQPELMLLDASMQNPLPGTKNVVGQEAIPGSLRFDLEQVFSDPDAAFPHTRLSSEMFESHARALGVRSDSSIVVYDNMGIYSAPRAWWMLRAMGHNNVRVLNGGLPAWKKAGLDTAEHCTKQDDGDFVASPVAELFIDAPELAQSLGESRLQIVDARSSARFYGKEPEPRAGVRSGHIPGAQCLHYRELTQGGLLQSDKVLEQLFAERNIEKDATVVFSCGSGITACIQALAAFQLGYQHIRVFDGSWAQWGATHSLPVALD